MPKKETAVMSAIRHNERCRDCKEGIKNLLAAILEDVEVNSNINLPARLEDCSDTVSMMIQHLLTRRFEMTGGRSSYHDNKTKSIRPAGN